MAVHTYQTNLTGGIMSPQMAARSDFKKYANGCEIMENVVVKATGGAMRRAGTQYVAQAKSRRAFQGNAFQSSAFQISPTSTIRLVPFVFNTNEAYVLEFGAGYIRFYRNRTQLQGSGTGAELVTNGTFTTDLTGWVLQQDFGATVTWDTDHAVLNPGAAGIAGMSQQVSGLDVGTEYSFTFISGGNLTVNVGTTLDAGDILGDTALTVSGTYRVTFVATQTSVYLNFKASTPSTPTTLDTVSLLAAAPLEIATPYAAEDLRELRFTQTGDWMYITHPEYQIHKLVRLDDKVWTIQAIELNPPPTEEVDIFPVSTLTPGAVSGTGVTFTTDVATFLAADVNRQIKSQGGFAVITAYVSPTQVTVDITSQFLSTAPIGPNSWSMDGSPYSGLTLSAKTPVNAIVTVTAATAGFRTTDLGAWLIGLDGMLEITEVTSTSSVKAKIIVEPTSTSWTAGGWTLERESFTDALGHPETCTFHEQRLFLTKGQTIYGSVSGDYENFAPLAGNDGAVEYVVAGRVDTIRWVKSNKNLIFGTIGNEYKADGGDGGAITPTSIKILPQSDWGSDPVPDALRAGVAVIFVQRGRTQIREMAFDFAKDGFDSADISILADHLFKSGIVQLERVSSPDSYILALMENGTIGTCAYERAEEVVAWTKFMTDGLYRALCVIPAKCGTGDEVWTAVERTINGNVENYIEVFDGQLNTDCAKVWFSDNGNFASTFVGFTHLLNETVDVLYATRKAFQPGAFQKNAFQRRRKYDFTTTVASGGVITTPANASRMEAGLHYESVIKPMPPEIATPQGSSMFHVKRPSTVYIKFICSSGSGILINGEAADPELLDANTTADIRREVNLGWDRRSQVIIRQTKPHPMGVLGIAYTWQVSDGDRP